MVVYGLQAIRLYEAAATQPPASFDMLRTQDAGFIGEFPPFRLLAGHIAGSEPRICRKTRIFEHLIRAFLSIRGSPGRPQPTESQKAKFPNELQVGIMGKKRGNVL